MRAVPLQVGPQSVQEEGLMIRLSFQDMQELLDHGHVKQWAVLAFPVNASEQIKLVCTMCNEVLVELVDLEQIKLDCPGAGRCHGPQNWCDRCGDVAHVCDDEINCAVHPRICVECGGTGELEASGYADECPYCNGTGYEDGKER